MNAGGETPKTCFVIAPIGDDESETRRRSDKVLRHIVRPVAQAQGYEAVRADEISEPGLITTQVIERIANDDLVIADLSEWNPNVFYELAVRHALRKPLVQIIGKGERIPFDVAAMRTIEVDVTDLDSVENAKAELARQIASLERDPDSLQTPLSFTLDVQALGRSGDPEGRSLAELASSVAELGAGMRKLTKLMTDLTERAMVSLHTLSRVQATEQMLLQEYANLSERLTAHGLSQSAGGEQLTPEQKAAAKRAASKRAASKRERRELPEDDLPPA